ncbi:ATP-dependent RNA helicase [Spironucleus salmonicida]|uniref:ATP-dependent RNA helicase n=1 Tax=Spironucleus salmonicida TaxID=348837 RepID=V6LJH4_9EUKA|nr:ATP-dependent RNA helicase [Spironucleus salmonicida]|eukprot:EST44533.1 ATP-dependent RNA helicase [Spironucleus salmonicida]
MHQVLVKNNLVLQEPITHQQGTSSSTLFNEICGFGFQPENVAKILNTQFYDKYLMTNTEPKDKDKSSYINRNNQLRQQALKSLLLMLQPCQIPQILGGSLVDQQLFSTASASSSSNTFLPMAKMGERKPKGKRRQGDNGHTIEDAANVQQEFEKAVDIVEKTGIVSEPLIREIVQICGGDPYISYLTVITSCMQYKRGFPKLPSQLKNDAKIETYINSIRQGEIQMIKSSGYDITQYTFGCKEKQPSVYIDLEVWTVKVPIYIFQNMQITLYFHLQDTGDVQLMKDGVKSVQDPPLIADGKLWKFNQQFKGTYPFTPCYIDLKSKYLTNFGKAATLKYLYQKMQRGLYNEQPIFGCILALQDSEYEKFLLQYEEIIQISLQKSCINLKHIDNMELKNSFVMKVKHKISSGNLTHKQKIVSLSPLLFVYKEGLNSVQVIQSTVQQETGEFLMVEDKYSILLETNKKLLSEKFIYKPTTCQQHLDIYTEMNSQQLHKKIQHITQSQFQKILTSRDMSLYNQYLPGRKQLPIYIDKDLLLSKINENQCVIVTAETGSGKSTNLPQLILEQGAPVKIVITQPRRMAAISLGMRVRQESGLIQNKTIGYNVKGKSEISQDTLIQYCTIGVLLRQFINNHEELSQYTHIIIDEVHERDINTDLFLGLLKQYYQFCSPSQQLPKIIIMSATIDGAKFGNYFSFLSPAYYSLKGRLFETKFFYLDDLIQQGIKPIYKRETAQQRNHDDYDLLDDFDYEQNDIENFNYIPNTPIDDFSLNLPAIKQIVTNLIYNTPTKSGNTLIFLPGQAEIQKTVNYLQDIKSLEILPCHSQISLQDQQKLFQKSNLPRVICATNIAEASITLPNIISVIDTGLERKVKFFPKQRKNVFQTRFISKESAQQRAGRAGRVCKGTIYCCYLRSTFDDFEAQRTPEICTSSLMNSMMQLMVFSAKISSFSAHLARVSQPQIFMKNVISPPKESAISSNLKELYTSNFILYSGGKINDGVENVLLSEETEIYLSEFGAEIAFLPIEPFLGKIIFYAKKLGIDVNLAKQLVGVLSSSGIVKKVNDNLLNLERKSDFLLNFKLFQLFLKGQNMKKYDVSIQALESAKDTLNQLFEYGEVKYDVSDINLIIPLLQVSLWPSVAFINGRKGWQLTNPKNELVIHPSSILKNKVCSIILYNEQLTTSQNFITTCSVGSLVALAFSCEKPEVCFRTGSLKMHGIEFQITAINAVILTEYIKYVKKYNQGYCFIKALMEYEMYSFK